MGAGLASAVPGELGRPSWEALPIDLLLRRGVPGGRRLPLIRPILLLDSFCWAASPPPGSCLSPVICRRGLPYYTPCSEEPGVLMVCDPGSQGACGRPCCFCFPFFPVSSSAGWSSRPSWVASLTCGLLLQALAGPAYPLARSRHRLFDVHLSVLAAGWLPLRAACCCAARLTLVLLGAGTPIQ